MKVSDWLKVLLVILSAGMVVVSGFYIDLNSRLRARAQIREDIEVLKEEVRRRERMDLSDEEDELLEEEILFYYDDEEEELFDDEDEHS